MPLCPRSHSQLVLFANMGNNVVTFTEEQLEDYQDCTFFTRKEILRVQKRFREVSPDVVPKSMIGNEASTVAVPLELMEKLPELKENPFRKRICEVFSRDGKGNLTFEDFLDLLSVFSEQAPRDIKVFYAFKIYDFDGDQYIGANDLERAIRLLTHNELTVEEMAQVCEKAIEEADVDGDGKLSYMEFEHVEEIDKQRMSNSPSSNGNKKEVHTKLRKRIDVIGGKQLSSRTLFNDNRNRPIHNDQLPEMHRTRRLSLSNIQDVGYSRTVEGKLFLQSQDKNIVQIDLTRSNEFPFRCQSQRLCLKRSNESLGSILNPICLSDELKFRKKWPDPHYERPTWDSMKWNTPIVNSDDEVKTLMKESSQSVLDYVRSTKELYDILMVCGCPKTVEKSLVEHQEDCNDVVWVQEDNRFKNRMEPTFLTEEARFAHMELEPQGLLASQQNSYSEGHNCSESDTDSVMIIDLDSQSSKDSNSQTDNALEVSSVLQNERRYSMKNLDFSNNQSDIHNPHVSRIDSSAVPISELAALESNEVSKYYANLFVGKSSEGNEYYSSNLVLLKGDENMVATAKVSEGKVVLHCIKSDFGEDQVSWDKDETITLYSDNTNKVKLGSGQSSRSSSSSHSSYSCQHGCCSAPSEKEACSMHSCSSHNMTSTDIDLHLTLEETRKASSELIVSTLVLHSIISGQSQKDVVDEILIER